MGEHFMKYTPTIGLEVHAELKTKSKMFCGCQNDPHHSEPNIFICPICTAQPGTLPVPNVTAIEHVLLFGRAVDATPAEFSEFDRKNYFYPDIPKAYQISQYKFPFLTGGELNGIRLTRVHLEEDTARSSHEHSEGSLVNFNRAGVPLMELVTEPDIHDAVTAGSFARELQLLLRSLGISDANMEKGEMRVEANISISADDELGTKVEVKNLNSFKSVEKAIEFEVKRQAEMLEKGLKISLETRGWDENKGQTFAQRSKETAKDYRYFPDPDLPKMQVQEAFNKSWLDQKIPIIPSKKRELYQNLGLPRDLIEVLISDLELDIFWSRLVQKFTDSASGTYRLAANYLTSDVAALRGSQSIAINESIDVDHYAELIEMLAAGDISSRVAKDLILELPGSETSPRTIAQEKGLLQQSDETALQAIVEQVVRDNESVADEYRGGKDSALNFLLGQAMQASKGSGNPAMFRTLLEKYLRN